MENLDFEERNSNRDGKRMSGGSFGTSEFS